MQSPLVVAIDEAMLFIKKHISVGYEFDGSLSRKEKWQYLLVAIRELLLNTVVHRDYKQASDITIKIFDDQIHFISPGKLIGGQTFADFNGSSYRLSCS